MATARHTCRSALLEPAAPATVPVRLEFLHNTVGVARVDVAIGVPLHLDAVRVREAVADGVPSSSVPVPIDHPPSPMYG